MLLQYSTVFSFLFVCSVWSWQFLGPKWSCLLMPGPNWSCLLLPGPHWSCLLLPGSYWSCLLLPGPNWSCLLLVPIGPVCSWSQLVLFVPGPNWSCLLLPGPYWSCLLLPGPYWSCLLLPGPNWSCLFLVPIGPVCSWSQLVLSAPNSKWKVTGAYITMGWLIKIIKPVSALARRRRFDPQII